MLESIRLALAESLSAIVVTNDEGIIVWVNAAFERMMGYVHKELAGQHVSTLSGPAHESNTDLRDALAKGEAWQGRSWARRKSGDLFWLSSKISPVRDIIGNATHFIGIGEEIAPPLATHGLEELATLVLRLDDRPPDHIVLTDPDGTLRYVSATVPGIEPEEVIGRSIYAYVPPDHEHVVRQAMQNVLDSRQPVSYQVMSAAAHGRESPYLCRTAAIEIDGRVAAIVLVAYDVSSNADDATRGDSTSAEAAQAARRRGPRSARASAHLSSREIQVLALLSRGLTNRQLAEELELSQRTVDHHVSHILTKLQAPNRTAAVVAAETKGILRRKSP
jgi:PAS domain S-box-containing protein